MGDEISGTSLFTCHGIRASSHSKDNLCQQKIFWCPNLETDVIKFVNSCGICLQTKPGGRDKVPHGRTYTPLLSFDCLTIDIMTPGAKSTTGHAHVLVVIDVISRYGWFLPLRNRKTSHVIDTLHKYIFNHWGTRSTFTTTQQGNSHLMNLPGC